VSDVALVVSVTIGGVLAFVAFAFMLYSKYKDKAAVAVEQTEEKTGIELFLDLQQDMIAKQQEINSSRAKLIEMQNRFAAAKAAVASLNIPPVQ
jgi:uncharacterized protein involved in exopolysaccharide biosynthesis